MNHEEIWAAQQNAWRNPLDVVSGSAMNLGIESKSLKFSLHGGFSDLLNARNISLVFTREYENILMALVPGKGKIQQSFMPLPHPSGLAFNNITRKLYIASTRNPNLIYEFSKVNSHLERKEDSKQVYEDVFLPSRIKVLPGAYYLHDLAFIGNDLHANAVGVNGIVKVDLNSSQTDEVVWAPKVDGLVVGNDANYMQINSIAAGDSIEESYFSASAAMPGKFQPGNPKFKVDHKGVIFSGKAGDIICSGLTRPHSARLIDGQIWVDNSGYGTTGRVDGGKYLPVFELPGWTRGLCHHEGIVFIGVSKVLKRFENYAPGLLGKKPISAIFAFDLVSGKYVGHVEFPAGNQIFSIEVIDKQYFGGFVLKGLKSKSTKIYSTFYKFKI